MYIITDLVNRSEKRKNGCFAIFPGIACICIYPVDITLFNPNLL